MLTSLRLRNRTHYHPNPQQLTQTWKKLIFVRKPIFGVEKCPQIQIVPKHIKVPDIAIFSIISDILEQKWINCG